MYSIEQELQIFGDDPRLDGTRIPNQDQWHTFERPVPVMPYRPDDYRQFGGQTIQLTMTRG